MPANLQIGLTSIVLIVSLVASQNSCRKAATTTEKPIDTGDDNVAKAKLAEADTLYDGRTDMAKARVAVAALRQAQVADYGNYEVAWKLSRAAFFVGDHTKDDDEKDDMFRQGIEAGKVAVKLQPDKPEGHFWLGANYGGNASNSTLASLASVQDIRGEMETVIKIDESYQGGSAYLGLGRLYLQAPRVLGGDTKKAIEYLEKGLRFGANNSLLRYHLAEAYAADGRNAEARKQIEALMAINPDPKFAAEHNDAVNKAKKLQEKLDDLR
ncbi:MAG TPA: TRAP transporter TatT component family protein [Pyrinomonadaceae bacterium]|nr:TRAP transporter TatT component family protein [Pyrinomonadaceae bacterium]